MKEKVRTTARTIGMAGIAIVILLSVIGTAYDNPLKVIFKAQYPPGDWNYTQNCGQASALMVFSFYNGTIPTEQGIKDIDIWLNNTYGKKQPIDNYNGTATTPTQLKALAKDYAGFIDSYSASKWGIDDLKKEIDADRPIIVLVNGSFLSQTYRKHYVVVKGYNDTHIITNDPGKTKGDGRAFANANFTAAMNDQKGTVIMVMPNSSPIPPNQKLAVLSPNGGENWPAGSEQKIQWKFTGNSITSVNIELQKGILLTETIAVFAPTDYSGDGEYLWTISTTQNTGADYKIIVTSTANSKYIDTSDGYFTIESASIGGPVHNVNKNTGYIAIQTAIDDANIGDEIHVYSGAYYENVNVSKRLILRGIDNGGGKPIINNIATCNPVILLAADGIIIDGFISRPELSLCGGIYATSNNSDIANNDVSNSGTGITLVMSNNNTLRGNNVSISYYTGISLFESNNNTVVDNNVSTTQAGNNIALYRSNNNTLRGNDVSSSCYYTGIALDSSDDNTVNNNNVSKNGNYGIFVSHSRNTKVYRNNFVDNSIQAYFEAYGEAETIVWDSGYPDGGNYWSDYAGIDFNNGINQDLHGSDGIGDTPYNIRGHLGGGSYGYAQDRYPLMNPYG